MSVFPCFDHDSTDDEIELDISLILGEKPSITIVILGASKVGKTSLVTRLITDSFSDHHHNPTDIYRKQVNIDGKSVTLHIYDPIGKPFDSMQEWMSKADVFLLVYSITAKATFAEMENMRYKLLKYRHETDNNNVPMVVVGSKCDMDHKRQISTHEAESFCKMINVPFFETSAKKRINITESFYQCFRQWITVKIEYIKDKEYVRIRREKMALKNKNNKSKNAINVIEIDDSEEYERKMRIKKHSKQLLNEQKKKNKNIEDLTMDINIAVIGTHSVGKHSMIHSYIGEIGRSNKRDTYYTSLNTREKGSNAMFAYKERLELIMNVYCIEYSETDSIETSSSSDDPSNLNGIVENNIFNFHINGQNVQKYFDKRIVTPSRSMVSHHLNPSQMTMIELDSVRNEELSVQTDNRNYFDQISNELSFDHTHNQQRLNITDIAKNNSAFLFVVSMSDKQSFVQCIDIIKSIKNDKQNYNYSKPILIVVTKSDLNKSKHQLTEGDIAEFAVDIGSPFILINSDNVKEPFHRAIASIRGYSTPHSFVKLNAYPNNDVCCYAMTQSVNGKYLYCGYYDGSLRIWDIETSICLAIIAYHSQKIYQIREHWITLKRQWWKPCRYLITCAGDNQCCVWLLFNNDSHRSVMTDRGNGVSDTDFYGLVNAANVSQNRNIPLFLNCPRFVFTHRSRIRSFCVCNHNMLCTVGDDAKMKLWSLINGDLLYDTGDQHLSVLNRVVFVKEFDKVFVAAQNQCIYSWTVGKALKGKRGIQLTGGHYNNVHEIRVCKVSKSEIYIISMDESGYIRCRNALTPHTVYWDYFRHNSSINSVTLCKLNRKKYKIGDYHYVLCTASRDKTVRGYAIPNGEVVFNIADTNHSLKAIDCNQGFIVSAGKDDIVRCYKLMSDESENNRHKIANSLRISLRWAYQRHQTCISNILCAKKQFSHMCFSCDRNGLILGWDMTNGACMACFGGAVSRNLMIGDPKRQYKIEIVAKVIIFIQLLTLIHAIDDTKYAAFVSNLFLFDMSQSSESSQLKYYALVPFEWLLSLLCICTFLILFYISYQFKYLAQPNRDRFKAILSFFNWVATKVGFIPILRNLFQIFKCDEYMSLYLNQGRRDCYSLTHGFYICITVIALLLFVPTIYRIELGFNDLTQINTANWLRWKCDSALSKRTHFASQRTNKLAPINKTLIIAIILGSLFWTESHFYYLLILLAFLLCIATLSIPQFYFRKMNIFDCALYFGVLCTYVWTAFGINAQISNNNSLKSVAYLCVLVPCMAFGALAMHVRVHSHWYDQVRGDFRKALHGKGIGLISEDVASHNLELSGDSGFIKENESIHGHTHTPIPSHSQLPMPTNTDNEISEFATVNNHRPTLIENQSYKQSTFIERNNSEQKLEEALPKYSISVDDFTHANERKNTLKTESNDPSQLVKSENFSVNKRERIDTHSSGHNHELNPIIKGQNSQALNPLSEEEDIGLLHNSNETSVASKEEINNCDDEDAITVIDYVENGNNESTESSDSHSRSAPKRIIDCDELLLLNGNTAGLISDSGNEFVEEAKDKFDPNLRKVSEDILKRKVSDDVLSFRKVSLQSVQNSTTAEFDYYDSINNVAPPSIPVLHSNRSNVTAFSGMEDVPDDIGAHLF